MTYKKTLAEQLAEMDLFGMSKCELLRELSGVSCCESFAGYDADKTPCRECREEQREALIARIKEEADLCMVVWPNYFPSIHWTERNPMQTLGDRVKKLREETEAVLAAFCGEDGDEVLAETIDAIHCCLEILRMYPPAKVEKFTAKHHVKNWDRGYYEPKPEEEPEKVE